MNSILQAMLNFLRREEGPTTVEYAIMLGLIIVVCIAVITTIGSETSVVFDNVSLKAAVSTPS